MSKIPSDLWRKVMQATAKYEEQWALGSEPTPDTFASCYPEIPKDVLTPELERLRIELTNESLQNFSNLKPLGKGGMGEVFEALDRDCQRTVAIKKIRWDLRDNHQARKRFQFEAELTASLEHPEVIPVYGLGIDDQGLEYYAMRLIHGEGTGTLADAIRNYHNKQAHQKNREDLLELIRRLIDVADTVAYAHHRNVVHRDLKPSNILIGPYGETLIADWGLARRLTPNNTPTDPTAPSVDATEDFESSDITPVNNCTEGVGTPGYADPELARLPTEQMLRSADIYSLGAVLHCILTGSRPTHDASSLSRLSHKVDKAIVAICNQAMAPRLTNRYASVEEFRDDLKRWIVGLSTNAYPEPWWEKTIKWPSRHRSIAAGLAGALAILILGGTAFLWFQADRNRKLQDQAIELENALSKSKLLLDQTRRAEQESRFAKDLAEKRESMAFESLDRFQDLFVSSLDANQSKSLNELRNELSNSSIASFEQYLSEFEVEPQATKLSIERASKTTQKLAALEGSFGQQTKANSLLDRTCSVLTQRLSKVQQQADPICPFLELQIGVLRSLQGNLAMRNGNPNLAKPALEEATQRLEPLLNSPKLSDQGCSEAMTGWLKAVSALGMHQAVLDDPKPAHAMMQKASLRCENQEPASFDSAVARIQFLANWSLISERIGNSDLAIEQLQKSRDSIEDALKRVGETPGGVSFGVDNKVKPSLELLAFRSAIDHNLARLLIANTQRTRGLKILEELLVAESESLLQSPSNSALQSQYQKTAATLQSIFDGFGRSAKAIEVSSNWILFAKELLEANPVDGPAMMFLINAYHQFGHLLEKYGRRDEAMDVYQNALAVCAQASDRSLVSAQILYQQVELQMHRFHIRLPTSDPQQTKDNFLVALNTALRLGFFTKSDSPERAAARGQLQRGIDSLVQAGLTQEAQDLRDKLREFEDLP